MAQKKSISRVSNILQSYSPITLIVIVVTGTELFHVINSLKLNLIMPTLSRLLNESAIRQWSIGSDPFCFRYGNVLWDVVSAVVFFLVLAGLYCLFRFMYSKVKVRSGK
jgi:large-conductance mechanosensitive channel